MKSLKITIALAVAALVPIAAGCGEKEEPPTTGPVVTQTTTGATTTATTTTGGGQTDEELIRATITGFLTKPNDPSVCDELITPEFLKKSYGNRQGCVAARKPNALADRATILTRKPGPGKSTIVTVKPRGGVFDGETLKVTVVETGKGWQIARITSNAKVGP